VTAHFPGSKGGARLAFSEGNLAITCTHPDQRVQLFERDR
jgi:hypothetical protein